MTQEGTVFMAIIPRFRVCASRLGNDAISRNDTKVWKM
jgi:hypothetical protein